MNLRRRPWVVSLAVVCLAVPSLPGIPLIRHVAAAAPPASSGDTASSGDRARRAAVERTTSRAKPFAPEKFLRAFRGNREDLRHKVLDDAERMYLAEPQLAPTLWQVIEPALKSSPAPDSLARAVRLYGRLDDPEAASRLVSLLSAADPRLVQTAIDILAERRPAAALETLVGLTEHPTYKARYGFRHALISAVARFNEPASVGFLVKAIGSTDGQLKYEISRELSRLTGENFGGKSSDWRKWWEAHRDGFRVAAPASVANVGVKAGAAPVPWDVDLPQFFGTLIYAKRIVFVIDKSKSMLSTVDGVTRLDNAEKELEAAIRKLPDDAWFDIIAYNDFEQPYAGKLVPATPAQKSAAVQFIYSLVAERQTDIYDTLSDALIVDSNIEAILFLSDGEPNVGRIVDCPTILQKITQQNAQQRTSINTIGIDAQGIGGDFLKKLAADNFGEYRSIR
jgi:hypothetical protein